MSSGPVSVLHRRGLIVPLLGVMHTRRSSPPRSVCVCVLHDWGDLPGSYLHPNTVIYLYTLTQGSILLPRSRGLPRPLMGTYRGSIIMRQKEIALERQ